MFAEVLAALGHPIAAGKQDADTTLDLARCLVAVAERHALAAQVEAARAALAGEGERDPTGVAADSDDVDSGYDLETARGFIERLALASWRADRLSTAMSRLRAAAPGAPTPDADGDLDDDLDDDAVDDAVDDDPSWVSELWDMAEHATIATDALIAVLASLITVPKYGITRDLIERLDNATALLVTAGRAAGRLREDIGMPDPHAGLLLHWPGAAT